MGGFESTRVRVRRFLAGDRRVRDAGQRVRRWYTGVIAEQGRPSAPRGLLPDAVAETPNLWPLVPVMVLAYVIVCARWAWLSDDAYISFRSIDNFVHGYGLTWNVAERVQSFTHPLWVLLLIPFYFVTREAYFTSLVVSLVVAALAAVVLATRVARGPVLAAAGLLILLTSRAFIDYSTSGLENPLSHLLLALLWWTYLRLPATRQRYQRLVMLTGLLLLNRLDLIWLALPPLLLTTLYQGLNRATLRDLMLNLLPLITWFLYALLYYGFPWPNTAYAKLGTAIPRDELVFQGLLYLVNAVRTDPVLATTVLGSMVTGLLAGSRYRVVAIGMALQLLYIVVIGGDFMSGRFFTPVLFTGVALLVSLPLPASFALVVGGTAVMLGLAAPVPTLGDTARGDGGIPPSGITDERSYYFAESGLINMRRNMPVRPNYGWAREGRAARDRGPTIMDRDTVGFFGYFAGPEVHIIDTFALNDPLLARLPAIPNPEWRIGHFRRAIPPGYYESISNKRSEFSDPNLREYYRRLSKVTRGSLWSWGRLVEIWRFNTGQNDHYLEDYINPGPAEVAASALAERKAPGTGWNAAGNVVLTGGGITVKLNGVSHARQIEVSLDNNDIYEFTFLRGRDRLGRVTATPKTDVAGLAVQALDVPSAAVERGYDRIVVRPVSGDTNYSIGHLILSE